MPNQIFAEMTASVSELKKNPMDTVASGGGFPVAILNRNETAFYCIPAEAYEVLIDKLEDLELAKLIKEREHEERIKVDINDL